jgi:hypothetical protein
VSQRIAQLLSQSGNFTFDHLFSTASQSIWQFFLPRFLTFAHPKLLTVRTAFANKKGRQSGNLNK